MENITVNELKENVKLRQAVVELRQLQILFDALADSVFCKTTDEEIANGFYLLQDTFESKLERIVGLL